MYFTKEDLKTIEEYLKLKSMRDSQFEAISPNDLQPVDTMVVVHENDNKKIALQDFINSTLMVNLIEQRIQQYENYRQQLDRELNLLKQIIRNVEEHKVGILNSFGDSVTYGVSQKVLTDAIQELQEQIQNAISFQTEEVSTQNKAITTTYKNIIIKQGDTVIADYITPTVTLTPVVYPKVMFIPADEELTAEQLQEYIASHEFNQTSFTHNKNITTTNYYVVLENGHTITSVTNSSGFSYNNAFVQDTLGDYTIYHYKRTLTVQISLKFNLN